MFKLSLFFHILQKMQISFFSKLPPSKAERQLTSTYKKKTVT